VRGVYIGKNQHRIIKYAKMADLEIYPVYNKGEIVVDLDDIKGKSLQ
jgi:hypothetical protein